MKRSWDTCNSSSSRGNAEASSSSSTASHHRSVTWHRSGTDRAAGGNRSRVRFIDRGRLREVDISLTDALELPAVSWPAEEYRATLRAHHFREAGWQIDTVAHALQRSEAWVRRCWQTPPSEVSRPREVPAYIARYELQMLRAGVEPFRPPELRRGYVTDAADLYLECAQRMPWRQAVVRKRNYETGDVTVTNIASCRQDCMYRSTLTGIPKLDEVLRRLCVDFHIEDPHACLVNNWYPDGKASIGAHSHDFWSAILSFGSPRVFLLDDMPILLGNGDLLVFGTQRHGVPKMPEVEDGRVSVAVFWYPEKRSCRNTGQQGSTTCSRCGLEAELLQQAPDGSAYCDECWADCLKVFGQRRDERAAAEEDMLAAALQLSMVEQ
mmetsp:Transcript_155182/g.268880  ORF Transcript_155182/g.268880 Transcript_155182/m.268880 type:complete len:381 (+) Transcript_155182:70-1212(+)